MFEKVYVSKTSSAIHTCTLYVVADSFTLRVSGGHGGDQSVRGHTAQ
jgi:hypothetical protein